jgi:hypothetical protein
VTRPRKPFGANHPGRLPATMVKVLAAEMSDPQRLRRGKQYAKDGSVLDIIVEPGVVTCEVQGSRATPYIASVEVTPGNGMPLRRDVTTRCTCPDDDNWDSYACKHVVAALFTLSDELLLEPELLDIWRNTTRAPSDVGAAEVEAAEEIEPPRRRHLSLVRPPRDTENDTGTDSGNDSDSDSPHPDLVAAVLKFPAGTELPEIPFIESIEPDVSKPRELAAVLRDAMVHLRIEWD